MSNIYDTNDMTIPVEGEEVPVVQYHGYIFKNKAWHCRVPDLWTKEKQPESEWFNPEEENILTLYLANFCRPYKNIASQIKCVACDEWLTGVYGQGDDWKWRDAVRMEEGSPTKEGRCSNCGYPLRARHLVKNTHSGKPIVFLDDFPLMYHPRTLSGQLRLG